MFHDKIMYDEAPEELHCFSGLLISGNSLSALGALHLQPDILCKRFEKGAKLNRSIISIDQIFAEDGIIKIYEWVNGDSSDDAKICDDNGKQEPTGVWFEPSLPEDRLAFCAMMCLENVWNTHTFSIRDRIMARLLQFEMNNRTWEDILSNCNNAIPILVLKYLSTVDIIGEEPNTIYIQAKNAVKSRYI